MLPNINTLNVNPLYEDLLSSSANHLIYEVYTCKVWSIWGYTVCLFPYIHLQHLTEHRLDKIDPQIVQYATLSLERSWRVVASEKSSIWTVIYAYATGKTHDPGLLEQLVWNLRSWPLELVMWGTQNSHRLDIRRNPEQDRWGWCDFYPVTCTLMAPPHWHFSWL